ncbi:unnamed protein product [Meloidogyne enterolobii]|uniref:Uncharacterized protein n=1 Tax=Meloidogyne enterolobii TaxID=390850 RepID=A0ACB1AXS6_MELEN
MKILRVMLFWMLMGNRFQMTRLGEHVLILHLPTLLIKCLLSTTFLLEIYLQMLMMFLFLGYFLIYFLGSLLWFIFPGFLFFVSFSHLLNTY